MQQYKNDIEHMAEFVEPNITLRMLYLTIVVVALFITCGLIRTLHEHGLPDIDPLNDWSELADFKSIWKRRRVRKETTPKHVRLPSDTVLDSLSDITLNNVFFFYIKHIQALCGTVRNMAKNGDGKMMCLDHFRTNRKRGCLVYSIRQGLDFGFEIKLKETYNCEIHTLYSHSLNDGNASGKVDTPGNDSVCHPKGITVLKLKDKFPNGDGRNRKNLHNAIRKVLYNANRLIDALYLDMEGEEWGTVQTLLAEGILKYIKQLLVVTHFGAGPISKSESMKILRQLYLLGFRIVDFKERETQESFSDTQNITTVYVTDVTFVNIKLFNRHRGF